MNRSSRAARLCATWRPSQARAPHVVGLEDGDEQNGIVVFGADNRRAWLKVGADKAAGLRAAPNGHLFLFRDNAFRALTLIGMDGIAFHPHGLSFRGSLLFVINHDVDGGDTIFQFEIDAAAATATLRASINHSLLHGLNDIVAVSATEFYATRWENAPVSSPRGVAEALLRLPWMYVARCAKATATAPWKCDKALENLTGPNGINIVGSRLLIAMPTLNRVAVYQRADNGTLTWEKEIITAAAGDNIHVTGDGRVLLTSHWNASGSSRTRATPQWRRPPSSRSSTRSPAPRRCCCAPPRSTLAPSPSPLASSC